MSHFDKRADGWDKGDTQVNGARIIADAIRKSVALNPQNGRNGLWNGNRAFGL